MPIFKLNSYLWNMIDELIRLWNNRSVNVLFNVTQKNYELFIYLLKI